MVTLFLWLGFLAFYSSGHVTGFINMQPDKLLDYQKIVDDYYQINGYIRPIEVYRTTAYHPIYSNTTKNKVLAQTLLQESSQLLHTYRRDDIFEMNIWSWGYDFSFIGLRNTRASCVSQILNAARTLQSQMVASAAALYNSTSSEGDQQAVSAFIERSLWLGVSALILPVLNSAKNVICPRFERADYISSRKFAGLWASPKNVWEVTPPRIDLFHSFSHQELRGGNGADSMLLQNIETLKHLARFAFLVKPNDDTAEEGVAEDSSTVEEEVVKIFNEERLSDASNMQFVPISEQNAPGAYFAYTSDTIVLLFRESDRAFDTFLKSSSQGCLRVAGDGSGVTMHGGFMLGYCCIEQRLFQLFDDAIKSMRRSRKKLNRIYVVGNSFGGALATLASYDFFSYMLDKLLRLEGNREVLESVENVRSRFFALVVGSPPVGSIDFKAAFDRLNINLFRYESKTDIISKAFAVLEWAAVSDYKFSDFLADPKKSLMKGIRAVIASAMSKLSRTASNGLKWYVQTTYVHVGTNLDVIKFGATAHFDTSCCSMSGLKRFFKKLPSSPSYYNDLASVLMFQSEAPVTEQYLFPRDKFRLFSYSTKAYCVARTIKALIAIVNYTRVVCDGTRNEANDNLFSFYRTSQDHIKPLDAAVITYSTDLSLTLSKQVPYSHIDGSSDTCLRKGNCGLEIFDDWYVTEVGSKNSVPYKAVVQLRPMEEVNGEKVFKKYSKRNGLVLLDSEFKANVSLLSYDQKFLEAHVDRMSFNPIDIVNAADLTASHSAFRIEKVDSIPHEYDWTEAYYSILQNDVFKIQAAHSKLALDVPGGKQTHELKMEQYKHNDFKNQRWTCVNYFSGNCQLKSRASKMCLTTKNADKYLVQTECNRNDQHQFFRWEPAQQRSFYIKSRENMTECLEVENASLSSKSFIKILPCSKQDHQRFQIRREERELPN